MKNNSNSKQNNKTIFILVAVLLIILALIFALFGKSCGKDTTDETTTSTTQPVTVDSNLNLEDITVGTNLYVEESQKVDEDMITLAPPKKMTTQKSQSDNEKTTYPKAETVTQGDGPGIEIIGDDDANAYNCGVKKHNCDSKETHDFIVSLEKKGCSICGSHTCKSFYAVDEWGNACYDITKCPKYTIKNDPTVYCSTCGKKIGDGSNGTCVRYVNDTVCEICHGAVKGKTCHSH